VPSIPTQKQISMYTQTQIHKDRHRYGSCTKTSESKVSGAIDNYIDKGIDANIYRYRCIYLYLYLRVRRHGIGCYSRMPRVSSIMCASKTQ